MVGAGIRVLVADLVEDLVRPDDRPGPGRCACTHGNGCLGAVSAASLSSDSRVVNWVNRPWPWEGATERNEVLTSAPSSVAGASVLFVDGLSTVTSRVPTRAREVSLSATSWAGASAVALELPGMGPPEGRIQGE